MWARLLKRYPAGKVAPFTLLVPVVGLYAAWLVFDERLTLLQWLGVAAVGAGLLVSNFGHRSIAAIRVARSRWPRSST
jgi:O-acetylserine/cysteine efflux transporter